VKTIIFCIKKKTSYLPKKKVENIKNKKKKYKAQIKHIQTRTYIYKYILFYIREHTPISLPLSLSSALHTICILIKHFSDLKTYQIDVKWFAFYSKSHFSVWKTKYKRVPEFLLFCINTSYNNSQI
jgi:hypothetical protein